LKGRKVVQHFWNIDGFNSLVAMVPEEKLGFVLLTNVSASSLGDDIMPVVWENIIGAPNTETAMTRSPAPTVEFKDTGAAKELIGNYTLTAAPVTVEIKESDGAITFNIPGQQPYTLKETSRDTYSMAPLPADQFSLKVKRDAAGKVVSVIVDQPGAQPEFVRKAMDGSAPTITVDELMRKTIDAAGGEANLRKITTRITESDIDLENQGVKGTSIAYAKAPNKGATKSTLTALGKVIATGWDFYDGTNGEEVYSFSPVDKFVGDRLADARLSADFYSQLDWKQNFKKIDVNGISKVDGEDAWTVRFEPQKGSPFTEYYSTRSYLLLKREGVIPSSTSAVKLPYWVTYSDYRTVDGITLPFKAISYSVSNGNIVTTVRSFKHNVQIDDSMFGPKKP
jgi:hypothetical protein